MNLNQYLGKAFPIGSMLSMMYSGDVITLADGSVWLAVSPTAPFAYTSEFEDAVGICTSPHPLMTGFLNTGLWICPTASFNIAYKPASNLICTATVYGAAVAGVTNYYYTHNGTSWTKRSFPGNGIMYTCIEYTAGKFFAVAANTTTSGILYSNDAINWSVANGVSLTPLDILSNGGNNIIIVGTSTTLASSIDGGINWLSKSCTTPTNTQISGQGVGTWNAGAGLFILSTTTGGAYQTSPTGETWTFRNAQSTFQSYSAFFINGTKYASNATVTIAVGAAGFFATTTDGLTWSNHAFMSPTLFTTAAPNQVYYDGTRFVVRFTNRVFYSTNGTTWIEGALLGGGTLIVPQSNGLLFLYSLLATACPSKMLKVLDVTLTTPQTVITQALGAAYNYVAQYYRIK